jgi:hydrogenase expression/formation protein HypD
VELLKPFEDPGLIRSLAERIARSAVKRTSYTFMEVCGTHTDAIGRWALRDLLPNTIRLVSGPGCPVCVTPGGYIDNACRLALEESAIVATFGDLLRVPGDKTSLESARSNGADIRVVYSPFDAISIAKQTDKQVVFLAVGFETTVAGIASTIQSAFEDEVKNLTFYLSLRQVPPALKALLDDPELRIDGFLLPGHVSVVIGVEPYRFLERRGVPGVIAGFEPVDVMAAVEELAESVNSGRPAVKNLYGRAVRNEGNPAAIKLFGELFDTGDEVWRGIGTIADSGYRLKPRYRSLDAASRFGLAPASSEMNPGCQCGRVLRGAILPPQCPLFGTKCVPADPVGPCMVSAEGSCAAYYRYKITPSP